MRRNSLALIVAFLGFSLWEAEATGPTEIGNDALEHIDALYERAMSENYRSEGLALMKESLDSCEKLLEANPSSYDLLWRSARSALELGETAIILKNPDWKDFCVFLAKKSIEWTDAAKLAEPAKVEGYFWQMKALGLLYEAKGAISLFAMGLAPKCRQNIDACNVIDPLYMDCTPILAKALYLFSLPPLLGGDLDAALAIFEEFALKSRWSFEPYRQRTSAAELLMAGKKKEYKERAKTLLLAVLADPTPRLFYGELAESLLAKLEKMPK